MKLKIFTIGKLSLKPVAALVSEYVDRIQHYSSIELFSFKTVDAALAKKTPQDFLVILEEKGKSFSSTQFSKWIEEKQLHPSTGSGRTGKIIFLIGPGEGLSPEIKKKADLLLTLSPMTLQHELALVIFWSNSIALARSSKASRIINNYVGFNNCTSAAIPALSLHGTSRTIMPLA